MTKLDATGNCDPGSDAGPHYETFIVPVAITVERGTFDADDDQRAVAAQLLEDATAVLNEAADTAHTFALADSPAVAS